MTINDSEITDLNKAAKAVKVLSQQVDDCKNKLKLITEHRRNMVALTQKLMEAEGVSKYDFRRKYGFTLCQEHKTRVVRFKNIKISIIKNQSVVIFSFEYNGKNRTIRHGLRAKRNPKNGETFVVLKPGFEQKAVKRFGQECSGPIKGLVRRTHAMKIRPKNKKETKNENKDKIQ